MKGQPAVRQQPDQSPSPARSSAAANLRQPSPHGPLAALITLSGPLFQTGFFYVYDNQVQKEKQCQSEQQYGKRKTRTIQALASELRSPVDIGLRTWRNGPNATNSLRKQPLSRHREDTPSTQ